MVLTCRWETGCLSLWAFVALTSWSNTHEVQGKAELKLSIEDVLHFKDEPNPKCFTQTWVAEDFTCFFKTMDDTVYDFYYTIDNPPRKTRCKIVVEKSQDGSFVHICSFPRSDIFLFYEIPLEVLEHTKNTSLYSRTVTVEDNILPKQPSNIILRQNDNIGELQVSWQAKCAINMYHKIRYSSKSLSEKIKQGHNKFSDTLVGLVPGEEVRVEVSVRCSPSRSTGHWSYWSAPESAVVPQTADDVALKCYTQDLFNITCQWDTSKYKMDTDYVLFYKVSSEETGWAEWTKCLPETNLTDQCGFHAKMHKKVRLKLSCTSSPLGRTFYTQDFSLHNIIQTSPPGLLRQNKTDLLCVNWESPQLPLTIHLQYEVAYRVSKEKQWMVLYLDGPETAACLKLPWGSQFNVKVRARPQSSLHSGYWSDWSDVLTAEVPEKLQNAIYTYSSPFMVLIQCSTVMLLILAVIFISLFSRYFSKLKQYFWPPAPNLEKVLQELLSDLNLQKWDPQVTAKQCYEETTASIVEVLSKDDDSGLQEASQRPAGLLSSSDTSSSSVGQDYKSIAIELYPDYVALNRNSIILCSKENTYIYEELTENRDEEKLPSSLDNSLSSDFSNQSYLLLAADSKDGDHRGHGNVYTNLPCY